MNKYEINIGKNEIYIYLDYYSDWYFGLNRKNIFFLIRVKK
jgi:hypothetical protein